jgi:hypothetical protein
LIMVSLLFSQVSLPLKLNQFQMYFDRKKL